MIWRILLLLVCAGCAAPPKPKPTAPPIAKMLFKPMVVGKPPPVQPQPLKKLPPLRYPTTPGHWWMEYSEDLVHWKVFFDFRFDYLPRDVECVAPKVGTKFFRYMCRPAPPESFQQRPLPPGLNVNQ